MPPGALRNEAGVLMHVGATLTWQDGRRASFECSFDRAPVQQLEVRPCSCPPLHALLLWPWDTRGYPQGSRACNAGCSRINASPVLLTQLMEDNVLE